MLLFLVIYLFSIMGCNFFGANDPAHFGTVPLSMLTLFQVSTLPGWSNVAAINWYGCEDYYKSKYDSENPASIRTAAGIFPGFRCDINEPQPVVVFIFFTFFIVLTSWVIMSLFIGVISMVR